VLTYAFEKSFSNPAERPGTGLQVSRGCQASEGDPRCRGAKGTVLPVPSCQGKVLPATFRTHLKPGNSFLYTRQQHGQLSNILFLRWCRSQRYGEPA